MVRSRYSQNYYALVAQEPKPKPESVLDDSRRPLSCAELGSLIGWSRSKIARYRKMGAIPYHRIGDGGYPFYFLDEVLEALRKSGSSKNDEAQTNQDSDAS